MKLSSVSWGGGWGGGEGSGQKPLVKRRKCAFVITAVAKDIDTHGANMTTCYQQQPHVEVSLNSIS